MKGKLASVLEAKGDHRQVAGDLDDAPGVDVNAARCQVVALSGVELEGA